MNRSLISKGKTLIMILILSSVLFSGQSTIISRGDPGIIVMDIGQIPASSPGGAYWTNTDDLIFIHHSVGLRLLERGLMKALEKKNYFDERNDIYYNTDMSNDSGRPDSIGPVTGRNTDISHWIYWFNDYFETLKTFRCADGENKIIMFKSCFSSSNIGYNGTEPGDPFSSNFTLANYKSVYRHYNGTDQTYSNNGYTYKPLEQIFAENPDILFIHFTTPPRHYGPVDATNDAEAARARDFSEWLKEDWIDDYNTRNPGLNNVAIFDMFDILAYPDNHSSHPNRLKYVYGGNSNDSHPSAQGCWDVNDALAEDEVNFLDTAWELFNSSSRSLHQWPAFGGSGKRNGTTSSRSIAKSGISSWNHTAEDDILTSVSIDMYGNLYFGSNDSKLYSLRNNGSLNWSYSTSGKVLSTPAIANDGTLYFGSDDGKLYALNQNGSLKWSFSSDGKVSSSPLIDGKGNVLFTSENGILYSIFENGTGNWNQSIGQGIPSSPSMDKLGVIYVGSSDGRLYAVNNNGTDKWNFSTGEKVLSIPAIDDDGSIIFGSDNGKLHYLLNNGSEKWNYTSDSKIRASPAIDHEGSIIYGDLDGSVYSIFPNGTLNWKYCTGGSIHSSPLIDGDSSIYIGSDNKTLSCLNSNGTLEWKFDADGPIRGSPSMSNDGFLYIGTNENILYCIGITEPDPPTGLEYRTGNGWVNISWDEPSNDGGSTITNFTVHRKIGSQDMVLFASLAPNRLFFNDTSITDGMEYHYYIRAVNGAGSSDHSSGIEVDLSRPVFGDDRSDDSATTGEEFLFNISASDNPDEVFVFLEYWYGSGSHLNFSMSGNNPYTYKITIPTGTIDDLKYIFHASDTSGNWNETSIVNILITDNDSPEFGTDSTPVSGTTGDQITLTIGVSDNIAVSSVYAEYWFGTGSHTNTSMTGISGSYSLAITIPSDSTSELHYIIHASDSTGNWAMTTQKDVTVSDDESPVFGTDSTPVSGTTGDQITLTIGVSDNIAVSSVNAEYWFGTGSHTNTSMTGTSGSYSLAITIPSDSTSELHYIIHTSDSSGNWAETSQKDVTISDNDRPVFGTDHTPSTATTGDQVTLSIEVSDNLDVSAVYAEYWFGSGPNLNSSMVFASGIYQISLSIPFDSMSTLYYIFHATDETGNWVETLQSFVMIEDDDSPWFGTDSTPASGTTGDTLLISIAVADNIEVLEVVSEYWFDSGSHTNISMMVTGYYYSTLIQIPSNSTGSLHYICHAVDLSGNHAETAIRNVTIIDDDRPIFGMDSTQVNGTTGDIVILSINVTDNIKIQSVFAEYWFGSGPHTNTSMTDTIGSFILDVIVPMDSTNELHYLFHVTDTSDNHNRTKEKIVIIMDDEKPEIMDDLTPENATTGDHLKFRVIAVDNIGIDRVIVEYWFGEGVHREIGLINNVSYYQTISIPDHSLMELHYRFLLVDTSNNSYLSSIRDVEIEDNDRPILVDDLSDDHGTTGDGFHFEVAVEDNIGINTVSVEYWIGNGPHERRTLENGSSYNYTIILPSDAIYALYYFFHFTDTSGNWNVSGTRTVEIIDNDAPLILLDSTLNSTGTGSILLFELEILDNIDVINVTLEIWYGDNVSSSHTMEEMNGIFRYEMEVARDSVAPLNYRIIAIDRASNSAFTENSTIIVIDTILPVISDVDDIQVYFGDPITIPLDASDNIGLMGYSLNGNRTDGVPDNISFTPEEPGTYSLTIKVYDWTGNEAYLELNINILPFNNDKDGDTIPDLKEIELGLDPLDGSDAILDYDGDTVNNRDEIHYGTDIHSNDSDLDGLPDGWEIYNDLDPLTFNANEDPDEDGKTNLDEYLEGTDPNEQDESDENGDFPILLVMIIIIVIILLTLGIWLLMLKGPGMEEEE